MRQVISGNSVSVTVEFLNSQDELITPKSATYSVLDESGQEIISSEALTLSGTDHTIVVSSEKNTLAENERSGYRLVRVNYKDQNDADFSVESHYVINQSTQIGPGQNAFASFGEIMMTAARMPDVDDLLSAEPQVATGVLAGAFVNISRLNINLEVGSKNFSTVRDMTKDDVLAMKPGDRERFIEGQIIEANYLLGGNPVEQRRRMGLMSESIGEVSQFFRPSAPVVMPVCNECARVLSRYTRRSISLARG